MPLANDRSKRNNAGSKMARLLNEEEEDEFYTNTYGGFNEEQDDVSYNSESSVSDVVDSDFDVDESQFKDIDSDHEDDELKRKKSRRVITKAYKEPKKELSTKEVKAKKIKLESTPNETTSIQLEKKSLRQSTQSKTAETTRQREQEYKEKMLKEIAQRKNVPEVRRLTQEELLEEAKITEEINIRSLAQYQRLELEKKKSRAQKAKVKVPMIRYHSVTVPLIDENGVDFEFGFKLSVVFYRYFSSDTLTNEIKSLGIPGETKCSRTFITFEDDASFHNTFPPNVKPKVKDKFCPITGEKAKYFDPLTKTPYANLAAFRVLRKLYSIHKQSGAKAIDLVRKFRRGEIHIGGTD